MATVLAPLPRFANAQDFLAWENEQPDRHEFVGGEVFLMAGGTLGHNLVGQNISAALRAGLKGRRCWVHTSDVKVVAPTGMVAYPDVLVRCGKMDEKATAIDDPIFIIEVLSPSTRGPDLVRKRRGYLTIPSLRHFAFVDPDKIDIELCSLEADGSWRSIFLTDLGARLALPALEIEIPLAEIYDGLEAGEPADG